MKVFVILFILVRTFLGNGEKLDRTYLPPPGSNYAGGDPGAIEVPFELSKDANANVSSRLSETNTPKFLGSELNYILQSFGSAPEPFAIGIELSSEKVQIPEDFPQINSIIDLTAHIISDKQTTYIDNNYQPLSPSHNNEPSNNNAHNTDSFHGDHQSVHEKDLPAQRKLLIDKSANVESLFSKFDKINESTISRNFTPKTSYNIKHPAIDTNFIATSNEISKNLLLEKPQVESDRRALILKYKNVLTPDGFTYSAHTSNGLHFEQNGTSTNGVKVQGSYSYTGDDGKFYKVTYTADENGFRPLGEHLPTSPPIPEAILKIIEQATRDKEAGIFDDGSYDEKKYGYKNYEKNEQEESVFQYNTKSGRNEHKSQKAYTIITTPVDAHLPNVELPEIKKINSGRTIDDIQLMKNQIMDQVKLSNNESANIPLNTSAIFKKGYFYTRPLKNFDLPNMENMYSTTEESLHTAKIEDETLEPYVIPNVEFNDFSDKNNIANAEKAYTPSTSTSNMIEMISESNSNISGEIYLTSTHFTTAEPFELLGTTSSSIKTFENEEGKTSTLTPQYYTNSWKDDGDGLIDNKNDGNFKKFPGFMDYPQSLNMHLEDTYAKTKVPSNFHTSVTETEFHDSTTQRIYPLYTNAGTVPTTEKPNREDFIGPDQTQKYDMNSGYNY